MIAAFGAFGGCAGILRFSVNCVNSPRVCGYVVALVLVNSRPLQAVPRPAQRQDTTPKTSAFRLKMSAVSNLFQPVSTCFNMFRVALLPERLPLGHRCPDGSCHSHGHQGGKKELPVPKECRKNAEKTRRPGQSASSL